MQAEFAGRWYPSAGWLQLPRNFGIDVALFGTKTFLEPKAHVGLAISLRFDKRPSQSETGKDP